MKLAAVKLHNSAVINVRRSKADTLSTCSFPVVDIA